MSRFRDLTGQQFGRLKVEARGSNDVYGNAQWICLCDCGNIKTLTTQSLRSGDTRSCGCLRLETTARRGLHINKKHGRTHTPEYRSWRAMFTRCQNRNHVAYASYGGRGITICERWQQFENFLEDMGMRPTPTHTLERENNNGNYEPSNCKWATPKEQASNRRPPRKRKPAKDEINGSQSIF